MQNYFSILLTFLVKTPIFSFSRRFHDVSNFEPATPLANYTNQIYFLVQEEQGNARDSLHFRPNPSVNIKFLAFFKPIWPVYSCVSLVLLIKIKASFAESGAADSFFQSRVSSFFVCVTFACLSQSSRKSSETKTLTKWPIHKHRGPVGPQIMPAAALVVDYRSSNWYFWENPQWENHH